jgi:large subunit ribosomal protein L14e
VYTGLRLSFIWLRITPVFQGTISTVLSIFFSLKTNPDTRARIVSPLYLSYVLNVFMVSFIHSDPFLSLHTLTTVAFSCSRLTFNVVSNKYVHLSIEAGIMPFTRFVEVGRIVLINYGPDAGKLATIIDIVDQNKCLIQGPEEITGIKRQIIAFKRINLTDLKIKIPRNAREKTLKNAWAREDTLAKWEATPWAMKLAKKQKRANLSDFDRFKVMVARKQKSAIIAKKIKELK